MGPTPSIFYFYAYIFKKLQNTKYDGGFQRDKLKTGKIICKFNFIFPTSKKRNWSLNKTECLKII